MYEYGTFKPVGVILRKVGIGRTTERDEPNQCTLYVYMDMLQ
jgi:hypothetical protein